MTIIILQMFNFLAAKVILTIENTDLTLTICQVASRTDRLNKLTYIWLVAGVHSKSVINKVVKSFFMHYKS